MSQSPKEIIKSAAEKLKSLSEIKPAEWADFVKTGHFKERLPDERDWWYIRAASILRKTERLGPIGVSKLRKKYGGRKNRGSRPEKTFKSAGNHIRKILQQLEKAGLIEQKTIKSHKGRVITKKGKELLNNGSKSNRGVAKVPAANPSPREPRKTTSDKRSDSQIL